MSLARDAAVFASQGPKRKNLIINGCFRVGQRAITLISHASNEFCLDRWKYVANTTAVVNTSQALDAPGLDLPFVTSYVMSPTTADTTIGTGQYAGLVYKIEGLDCQHLRMGTSGALTVTLSFWHNHTLTGTHSGSLRNNAINRSYVFEYTQSVSETWEKSEITIPLDQSGTWLTDTSAGIILHLAYAVGSTYAGTVDTWQAGNYIGSANQVNSLGHVDNRVEFAQVQLELGDEATDFEQRSMGEEELLCYRYYWKAAGAFYMAAFATGVNDKCINIQHPVPMRGTPMVSVSYSSTTSGSATQTVCKDHITISHTDTDGGVAGVSAYAADAEVP